jgi:hypothetical protein
VHAMRRMATVVQSAKHGITSQFPCAKCQTQQASDFSVPDNDLGPANTVIATLVNLLTVASRAKFESNEYVQRASCNASINTV